MAQAIKMADRSKCSADVSLKMHQRVLIVTVLAILFAALRAYGFH